MLCELKVKKHGENNKLLECICLTKIKKSYGLKIFQVIHIKFTITDCSNFDKRCSGAHFVSFLFYYYCTY